MTDEEPTEGRRVGIHPLIVLFGVIFGIWLFITLIIPKSKILQHTDLGLHPIPLRHYPALYPVISSRVSR